MGFNIAGAEQYIALNSKAMITKSISGAQTQKLLSAAGSLQVGIKGSAALMALNADVNFVVKGCSRVSLGSTTVSNKRISVVALQDNQSLCPADIDNKFASFCLTAGQNLEGGLDAAFASQIMDIRAALIANANEVLIWQGDTVGTNLNINTNKIDGFLKLIVGSVITATGADVIAKLQSVYTQTPIKVRSQADYKLFISKEIMDEYTIALAAKNIYKPTEDFKLFGTSAVLVPVDGLNGVRKVFSGRLSNMVLGADLEGDADKATMRYSVETGNTYLDFGWAIGAQIQDTTEAFWATV